MPRPAQRARVLGAKWGAGALLTLLASLMFAALSGPGIASAAPVPPTDDTVRVFGTLRNSSEPVAGVKVDAKDQAGAVVESATSSNTGTWEMNVPPGNYSVAIDESTVPDGVEVQKDTVEVSVTAGSPRPVIFLFGEKRSSNEVSAFSELTRLTIDGLRFGLIIAICGVGLSLIFGTTGLTNFAHGELVTLGAVVAWFFNVKLGIQLIPATILAIVVGIGIGIINELGHLAAAAPPPIRPGRDAGGVDRSRAGDALSHPDLLLRPRRAVR